MSITSLLRAFVTVFPAELPDKSMLATVILVTRYGRPMFVWAGAITAFALHVTIATTAGGALGLLPEVVVQAAVTTLFAVGAVLLFLAARRHDATDTDLPGGSEQSSTSARAAFLGSFGLIAMAEWGDLTQLATAGLAASSGEPLSTGLGALAALGSVAAIGVLFGRRLATRIPLHRLNYAGAAVFAALAVWSAVEMVR